MIEDNRLKVTGVRKKRKLTRSVSLVEAQAKYQKEKTRQYGLRFCLSKDADIIDYLDATPTPKREIFREAIRDYIQKNPLEN